MTADRIKALRMQSGMTQEELAGKLRVTRANVSAWEHGIAMPSTGMLIKLTKLFGVTSDYLLGINEETEMINIAPLKEGEKKALLQMLNCFQEHI